MTNSKEGGSSLRCYLNLHDWRVTHRTVTLKFKSDGLFGSFAQAIWGPGLGYGSGTLGNYSLCQCSRCKTLSVFIEYGSHSSGQFLNKNYSATNKTSKDVEDIQLRSTQTGKPFIINLEWKPVTTDQ